MAAPVETWRLPNGVSPEGKRTVIGRVRSYNKRTIRTEAPICTGMYYVLCMCTRGEQNGALPLSYDRIMGAWKFWMSIRNSCMESA